jgi:hypothetical protein
MASDTDRAARALADAIVEREDVAEVEGWPALDALYSAIAAEVLE